MVLESFISPYTPHTLWRLFVNILSVEVKYRCPKCKRERDQISYPSSSTQELGDLHSVLKEKCLFCNAPMIRLKIICDYWKRL